MKTTDLLNMTGPARAKAECEAKARECDDCGGLGFAAYNVGTANAGIQRCDSCGAYATDEDAKAAAKKRLLAMRFPSRQRVLTQSDIDRLPMLYATDGVAVGNKIAQVKFFDPAGRWTFYAVEFDGVDQLFGWCVSPLGPDCDELGYASLAEIVATTKEVSLQKAHGRGQVARGQVCMERDEHFKPTRLGEIMTGVQRED